MNNNQTKEQYLLKPEIIANVDFMYLEKEGFEALSSQLKDLKETNFAKIVFMTKVELVLITKGIKPTEIWKLVKKIKADVI